MGAKIANLLSALSAVWANSRRRKGWARFLGKGENPKEEKKAKRNDRSSAPRRSEECRFLLFYILTRIVIFGGDRNTRGQNILTTMITTEYITFGQTLRGALI